MPNEALSLPINALISLGSLEPGLSQGDVIYWNGT